MAFGGCSLGASGWRGVAHPPGLRTTEGSKRKRGRVVAAALRVGGPGGRRGTLERVGCGG